MWRCTFDTVSIAESVEGVLHAAAAGADVGNHDSAGLFPRKAVTEHLSELGASERHMPCATIQCTNALLEREQRLVDLCSLEACLPVVVKRVGTSLAAGQVNEGEAANLQGCKLM